MILCVCTFHSLTHSLIRSLEQIIIHFQQWVFPFFLFKWCRLSLFAKFTELIYHNFFLFTFFYLFYHQKQAIKNEIISSDFNSVNWRISSGEKKISELPKPLLWSKSWINICCTFLPSSINIESLNFLFLFCHLFTRKSIFMNLRIGY